MQNLKKINSIKEELQFLKQCLANTYSFVGKERFIEILKIVRKLPEPESILDVGGNAGTAKWLQAKFPNSKITILNKSKKQLGSYEQAIIADAQSFNIQKKFDLILAGELIEHLYNPDGLISSCLLALKSNGYFIITTPNMSCLHNRLFLLFGWSLANYTPSLRYRTGNPFYSSVIGKQGYLGDHKSVFTYLGLKELLKIYGFKILAARGYCYGEHDDPGKTANILTMLRVALNKVLPHKYREGMLFVSQAPNHIDNSLVSKGILKE